MKFMQFSDISFDLVKMNDKDHVTHCKVITQVYHTCWEKTDIMFNMSVYMKCQKKYMKELQAAETAAENGWTFAQWVKKHSMSHYKPNWNMIHAVKYLKHIKADGMVVESRDACQWKLLWRS